MKFAKRKKKELFVMKRLIEAIIYNVTHKQKLKKLILMNLRELIPTAIKKKKIFLDYLEQNI